MFALVALLLTLALTAPAVATTTPLPVGSDADYQLGGARPVPANVGIVARDRRVAPLAGVYNICYVNGFQTQAEERHFWRKRMTLVLQKNGKPVVDAAWNEWLLDLRTAHKRDRLSRIVGVWTRRCAAHGFDAVEFDNLDSYTRSHGLLTRRQARDYAHRLVRTAHRAGLAAGQKNLSDLDGRRLGYDFAVAEECGRYRECSAYVANFGRRVLSIEYRRKDFEWTCAHYRGLLPVVLRDLDLSPTGVREWC